MTEQLKGTLIEILTYFKTGLDDIEAGSEERQNMQDEIDFALPLVKKLIIADVIVSFVCDNCQNKEGKELTTSTTQCKKCHHLQAN